MKLTSILKPIACRNTVPLWLAVMVPSLTQLFAAPLSAEPVATLPPLRVSENHRFLVTADGKP